jgi:hypothetical protein
LFTLGLGLAEEVNALKSLVQFDHATPTPKPPPRMTGQRRPVMRKMIKQTSKQNVVRYLMSSQIKKLVYVKQKRRLLYTV